MGNATQKQTESDINQKLIWEQLLSSNPGPDNAQLCYLVIHSEPLAEKALEQLFKQEPTKFELYQIMRDGKPAFKEKAFEILVTKGESIYKFVVSTIIQIPELREVAWQKFISLSPRGKELRLILDYVDALKDECWKIILTQQISNDELIHLMQENEGLREAAWDKLTQREHTNRELCRIIEHVKEFRQKAWNALMKRGATNTELRYLIDHVPAVREIAEYKLFKETEDILKIVNGMQ
ncbi:hypothetical protein KKI24_00920 [bacterium]|nr:hypothetical protein [bacterium]